MAYAAVTTTEVANLIETQYRKRFGMDATERMVIAADFDDATEGLTKVGKQVVIRKISAKNANTATATSATDPATLTWEQDVEAVATANPVFRYGAVGLNAPSRSRLVADKEYRKGVKEQLLRAVTEAVDQSAGDLASALVTNISGSGAVNLDQSLILDGLGKLRTTAKRESDPLGKVGIYFNVHPKQLKNLFAISNYMNAQFRGEMNGPVKTGVVVPGWGLTIKISGNVDDSGGALHNLMHLKEACAIGYNEKPQLLPDQPYALDILLISFVEAAVVTVFDTFAADVQTSNA